MQVLSLNVQEVVNEMAPTPISSGVPLTATYRLLAIRILVPNEQIARCVTLSPYNVHVSHVMRDLHPASR